MNAPIILIYIVIPLVGVTLILFCLLSYLFPFGERLRGKSQKIKGPFGIDLEVSPVALFFLVGGGLCLSSAYLHYHDAESRLIAKEQELVELRKDYESKLASKQLDLETFLRLPGAETHSLDPNNLVSRYKKNGPESPVEGSVMPGPQPGSVTITLRGVTPETSLRFVELEEKTAPHRKWIYQGAYWPLQPTLDLKVKHP
jgi:hypothetical protein